MIYDVSDVKFTSVLLVYICAVYIYIYQTNFSLYNNVIQWHENSPVEKNNNMMNILIE
jgi:hypothetical protein